MAKLKSIIAVALAVALMLCLGVACDDGDKGPMYEVEISYNSGRGTVKQSVAATEDGKYKENTEIVFTIKPNDGYKIKSVSINDEDCTESLTASSNGEYTYKLTVDKDYRLRINFVAVDEFWVKVEGFSDYQANVSISPNQEDFKENTLVSVLIVAKIGYALKIALMNGVDIIQDIDDGIYQFNITENTTIRVEFEPTVTYKLTIAEYDNTRGTVKVFPEKEEYATNEPITITVTPNNNYEISSLIIGSYDASDDVFKGGDNYLFGIATETTITVVFGYYTVDAVTATDYMKVVNNYEFVLIDFWSVSCPPCLDLNKRIPEISNLHLGVKIVEMDIGNFTLAPPPERDVYFNYNNMFNGDGSVPFLVMFHNGQPVGYIQNTLGISYDTLLNWIKSFL